ncbi:hypothetical protein [Nitrosomonas supralitoralis]|nr:hypothetical protein [Nitrosomonas supralitoralis]
MKDKPAVLHSNSGMSGLPGRVIALPCLAASGSNPEQFVRDQELKA